MIQARAARVGLDVPDPLAARAAEYMALLRRWNQRMNLTRLGEDDLGVDRLVVEPLAAAARLPAGAATMVDIGSGGGSPAVPMKLARPEMALRMVEARNKKAAFLRELVRGLALTNVDVHGCRYEWLAAQPDMAGCADVVTVRAVKVDRQALSTLGRLLRKGGRMFLFRAHEDGGLRDDISAALRWEGSHVLIEGVGSVLVVLRRTSEPLWLSVGVD